LEKLTVLENAVWILGILLYQIVNLVVGGSRRSQQRANGGGRLSIARAMKVKAIGSAVKSFAYNVAMTWDAVWMNLSAVHRIEKESAGAGCASQLGGDGD
jgi:hypothetical protein